MKKTTLIVAALALALVPAPPTWAQDARADAQKLLSACEQHGHDFDSIYGNSLYYGGPVDEARQALATVEKLESDVLPEVQPILAVFAERYESAAAPR